jgi:serine/threonine protein kinase SCH9
LILT